MANPRICSIEGCGNIHTAKSLCSMHYQRMKFGKQVIAPPKANHFDTRRFIQRCMATKASRCIEWPFSKMGKGYGRIQIDGHVIGAHRYVCVLAYGAAPTPKHQAAHNCGNPACCNPKHLRWATQKENDFDKWAHGTQKFGEQIHSAKIKESDVVEIRALKGVISQSEIAAKFGISRSHVSNVTNRKTWRHIP